MATAKTTKGVPKTKPTQWIAERRLERRDDIGGIVIVRIGIPEIDLPHDNWRCPFIIEGLGDDTIHYGKSIDSMAALQNALLGIRLLLERTGIPLRWEGFNENITGFPRDVPWDFGLAFYRKIEQMIEVEQQALFKANEERAAQREAEREAKRKARRKPSKKT